MLFYDSMRHSPPDLLPHVLSTVTVGRGGVLVQTRCTNMIQRSAASVDRQHHPPPKVEGQPGVVAMGLAQVRV